MARKVVLHPQLSGGTMRNHRLLPALVPERTPIDDRSPAQKMHQTLELARLFKYYSPTNAVDGNWREMLEQDMTFVLAGLSEINPQPWLKRFKSLSQNFTRSAYTETRERQVARLFGLNLDLAGEISRAIQLAGKLPEDPLGLKNILIEIVSSNTWAGVHYWGDCWRAMFAGFNTLPDRLVEKPLSPRIPSIFPVFYQLFEQNDAPNPPALSSLTAQFEYLKRLFQSLLKTMSELKKRCTPLFEQSLTLPNHQPHNGLLLAFLKMLEAPTTVLNSFTRQHLDFYYERVLQLHPLPGVPDQVLLHFALKKGAPPTLIPKGTRFKAGKGPSHEPILYALDQELVVNQGKLAEVMTIFNGGIGGAIPAAHQLFAAAKADSANGLGAKFPPGADTWAPFGEETPGALPLAKVGWAMSDPIFQLSQGHRKVSLFLKCSEASFSALQTSLQQFAKTGENAQTTFQDLAGYAFEIQISGPKGWITLPLTHAISLFGPTFPAAELRDTDPLAHGLQIELDLPASQAAWAPVIPAKHGKQFPEGKPVLKMELRQSQVNSRSVLDPLTGKYITVSLSPYNLLQDLELVGYEVVVAVGGKTDLLLQTHTGKQKPGKPFKLFGPQAENGSELYLGSYEVFSNHLEALQLNLTWQGLPDSEKGFVDYYQTYNLAFPEKAFHNEGFRVAIEWLQNGKWQSLAPPNGQADYPLFTWTPYFEEEIPAASAGSPSPSTSPADPIQWLRLNQNATADGGTGGGLDLMKGDGKLNAQNNFSAFDLSKTQYVFSRKSEIDPPASYEPGDMAGFLRLRLTGPEEGFGAGLYVPAQNWAAQQTTFSLAKTKPDDLKMSQIVKAPRPPFSPDLKSISVDYTARSQVHFGKVGHLGRFFHLLPFGTMRQEEDAQLTLLPQVQSQGNLLLGIAAVQAPQIMTLLFEVDEMSSDVHLDPPTIVWSWLKAGQWVPFEKTQVLADTTHQLLQSGIVKLDLLEGPSPTGGVFAEIPKADELLWIRASIQQHAAAVCRLRTIMTQAGTATYVMGKDAAWHLARPLKAKTIQKLFDPIPSIGKIVQPLASTGGALPEQQTDFYTRVHERLRHKQRAVSAWDYERLLLQQFSALEIAYCLRERNEQNQIQPGHIVVAVLPSQRGPALKNALSPSFGHLRLLEMQQYLQDHASEMVQVKVLNPAYEYLKVLATVEIQAGLDPGYYLDQLNKTLIEYIAPWSSVDASQNPFQYRLTRASILKFIQEQSYVQSVTRFTLLHYQDGNPPHHFALPGEFERILPSKAWGVLTSPLKHLLYEKGSVAATQHYPMALLPAPHPQYPSSSSSAPVAPTPQKGVDNCFTLKPPLTHG